MNAPTDQPFRLRSVALPAFGPSICEAIGYGATIPMVPLLARSLGASVGVAAFVTALLGVGQLLASLPAGSMIARVGERRALLIASVVATGATAVAGSAPNVVVLALAVLVIGMSWSVFLLSRQGYMIDAVPPHLRARALSSLGGAHRVGMVFGPLIAAVVVGHAGLRGAFAVGVAGSLAALLLVVTMPDLGGEARAAALDDPASIWQVLGRHRQVLATIGVGAAVISAARALRMTLLPLWADHVGLAAEEVSLIFGVGAAVEVALFYPAGWVMDRFGRVFVAVPCVVTLGLGLLVLPAARGFGSVLAVGLLMALGNGIGAGIVMTLGADTAPVVHRAKYLGGWRLVGDIGATGGPFLVTVLVAAASLAAASLALGGAIVFAAGWLAVWVGQLDRVGRGSQGGTGATSGRRAGR